MYSLIEMLSYKRPEGTTSQRDFCERFLEPVFGKPDIDGNYILQIGQKPRICFTAHHDTVHKTEGMQKLIVMNDVVSVADQTISNCLGADCTTGIYVILNMIEAGIEGMYCIFAAEEVGCKGSSALVKSEPKWLSDIDAVISFDRFGDKSVITHQSGVRTCSDEFAKSFSDALDLPQLIGDDGGSYTDSNEFIYHVSECTNISVGYYNQHTKNETQDLVYLDKLITQLLSADWSKLVFVRDPDVYETIGYYNYDKYNYYGYNDSEADDMEDFIGVYKHEVAKLLCEYGFTVDALAEELHLNDTSYINSYARRRGNSWQGVDKGYNL